MSNSYSFPYKEISYSKRISKDISKETVEKVIFNEKCNRPIENKNSNLASILLFGCSFIQGHMLEDNETISYKLGDLSKRPVYNRADGGWGPQHMLMQLRSDELLKIVEKEPFFVVYTYIPDHLNRMGIAYEPILNGGQPSFVYKKEGESLIYKNSTNFAFKFPLLSLIKQTYYMNFKNTNDKINFLKLHFLESKKEINKKWKDAKFLVFIYYADLEILSIINSLRENGIYVITFEELMKKSPQKKEWMISEYDVHPNALAWDFITPKLYDYMSTGKSSLHPELSEIEKLLIKLKPQTSKSNFKELFTIREYAASFSLCYRDRELIKNKEANIFQTSFAFIIWSIGNFTQEQFKIPVQKKFNLISLKINPKNEYYKKYEE